MAPEPTLEKVDSRSDYNFHTENVLLVSESKRCFDQHLDELMQDVLEDASGYGDHFDYIPHSDGYDLLVEPTHEDRIISLENSVWLVEGHCFNCEEIKIEEAIQYDIPPEAEVIVWTDPEMEEIPESNLDDIDGLSHKVFLVETEQSLRTAIQTYFTRDCHPRRSKHCVDWKIAARNRQERII